MSDNDWRVWSIIGLLTLATVFTRSAMFLIGHAVKLPPKVVHALRYAPAAALSAIIAPDLVLKEGMLDMTWTNPKWIAAIAAASFFLKTRHLLGTLVIGMLVFSLERLYL